MWISSPSSSIPAGTHCSVELGIVRSGMLGIPLRGGGSRELGRGSLYCKKQSNCYGGIHPLELDRTPRVMGEFKMRGH